MFLSVVVGCGLVTSTWGGGEKSKEILKYFFLFSVALHCYLAELGLTVCIL